MQMIMILFHLVITCSDVLKTNARIFEDLKQVLGLQNVASCVAGFNYPISKNLVKEEYILKVLHSILNEKSGDSLKESFKP
jgi:hypothetical protein